MKLSIFRRSFWSSSLFRISISTGILLWISLQIPLLGITYIFYSAQQNNAISKQQISLESLLLSNFEIASRFGDLVNARGQVLSLGKPFGLLDIGLCRGDVDILPKIEDSRCSSFKKYEGRTHNIFLLEQEIHVQFYWDRKPLSILDIISVAALISCSVSLILIFATSFIMYLVISRKVQNLADQLSEDSLVENKFISSEQEPIFIKLRKAIVEMKERTEMYFQENADLRTRAAISDIARQVAHDIRSPLSALNVVAHTFKNESSERFNLVTSATERINSIAKDLLKASKQEVNDDDNTKSVEQEISLSSLAVEIIAEKRLLFNDGTTKIDLKNTGENLLIRGDRSQLARVLSNLINNSIEAIDSEKEGHIELKLEKRDADILVIITDNGRGMSDETLERIGRPGSTFGKSANDASGFGLGVSHAFKAISAMGGTIRYKSKLGEGTIVTITFGSTSNIIK